MSDPNQTSIQKTEVLLRELLREVRKLKSENKELTREVQQLRKEAAERPASAKSGLLGNGSTDQLALRQQIMSLIEKIDKHLPGGAS